MKIPVIYFDNSHGNVTPEALDDLIRRRMIIAFRRSNNWVRVGGDPVRETGAKYKGADRRKK
jgi:hypothetical protein